MKKVSTTINRPLARIAGLLLGTLFIGSNIALADHKHKKGAPDQPGPYSIGHTTVILTDTTRNLDGSTPATAAGRHLYLDIWYPTDVESNDHILYDWNNPLYNENPGSIDLSRPARSASHDLGW